MIYANMLGGMGGLYPTSPQSHKNVMIAGQLGISPINETVRGTLMRSALTTERKKK